ncbi:MAG: HAMP domain-containing histidine kinase [Deltaproteobacteria bacterium]|nr:HAMP domain-containing histidine kinase [Deltaproteobacteria bacterium]
MNGWRARWRRARRAVARPGAAPLRGALVLLLALAGAAAAVAVGALPLLLRDRVDARSAELQRVLERGAERATQVFRERAQAELLRAAEVVRAAEHDVTTPLAGVERWSGGSRVLPPAFACSPHDPAPSELRELADDVTEAAHAHDAVAVERTVRRWLAHRANERHQAATDLVASLAPLEALVASGLLDPALQRSLLVDGLAVGDSYVPALLQQALRALPSLCDDVVAQRVARLLVMSGAGNARMFETLGAWRALPSETPPTTAGRWVLGDRLFAEVLPDGAALLVRSDLPIREARAAIAAEGVTAELTATDSSRWTALDTAEARPVALAGLAASRARVDATLRAVGLAGAALTGGAVLLLALDRRRRRQVRSLRRDLIAAVAHELKTPLASLRLQADALERRLTDGRSRSTLGRMQEDVDALESMVENVLCYGRVARGGVVLRETDVALLEQGREALERAQQEHPGLEVELCGDDVSVRADGELLRLVLGNLVRNAWRHNARTDRRVSLAVAADDGVVRISVRDNGTGIDPAERARIFRPFERALTPSRGSGLGLALSREIAALHGGDVRLADSGPQGSTFVLELPA